MALHTIFLSTSGPKSDHTQDRISAYDVILKNGIPSKGALLTNMTKFWFNHLTQQIPNVKTHLAGKPLPDSIFGSLASAERSDLAARSMLVKRLRILPIESIVRGYITGSAWAEYRKSSTVHGISLPAGLQESQALPKGAIWTPSTKAEAGEHDENIHPDRAREILAPFGPDVAARVEHLSVQLYRAAHDYAKTKGIIIADTKFEFGLDSEGDVVLADEVLTPDSSRFWPADSYEVGKGQASFDKQFLRDWLVREGLKGKEGVEMPQDVVDATREKYQQAYTMLTGAD